MAVEKMGYRKQSQSMLSTIMFRNSLLAGWFEAWHHKPDRQDSHSRKNRRINWQGNRKTECHDAKQGLPPMCGNQRSKNAGFATLKFPKIMSRSRP